MSANRNKRAGRKHVQTQASQTFPVLPPAFSHVLFPLLLFITAAFLAIHLITDPDFWYHSAFGREVIHTGIIPRTDIFSYTAAGHRWISSGWVSAIALHAVFTKLGALGPALLVFLCVVAASLTTYAASLWKYRTSAAAVVLLIAAMLASYPRFNPRPDIVSQLMVVPLILLLSSTEIAALGRPAQSQRRLWLLPLYFALWANLHALFFLGLNVVALYAAWRFSLWRKTAERVHLKSLLPCGICFVTWLLNPYGWRLLQFVYDNATLPRIGERVYELKPLLNAESLRGGLPIHILIAILLLLIIAVVTFIRSRKEVPIWRTGALAMFVFLLFYQRRQVGLAGAAIPALLVPNLSSLDASLRRNRWLAASLAVGGVIIICALRMTGILEISRGFPRAGVDCEWFPCNAAKFLRQHPAPPQIFHDLYTGGYLLHELGPEQKVFIDGRLEIYKDAAWQDYFAPPEARLSFDQLFAKYGIQTALLDIRGTRGNPGHLANQLAARSDWLPIYFDDQYCALVRETSATASYINEHGFRFVNPLDWKRLDTMSHNDATRAAALQEAERAVSIAPASANANVAMALVQYNRGSKSEGDRYQKAAQAIDPTVQLTPARANP